MKKIIILSFLLLSLFGCKKKTLPEPKTESVYICTGSKSEAYHKINTCLGLNHCSGMIEEVTKTAAIEMQRKECGICY
jgi:hypothetical protein